MSILDLLRNKDNGPRLTEGGKDVKHLVLQLFSDPRVAPECRQFVENLPSTVFNQLGVMNTTAEYGPHDGRSQFEYEFVMLDFVLNNEATIKQLLLPEDNSVITLDKYHTIDRSNIIGYLMIFILLSDIGKIGPKAYDQASPTSVVARIYNQAIFHKPHEQFLAARGLPTNFYSYSLAEALQIAQQTAMNNLVAEVRMNQYDESYPSLTHALEEYGIDIAEFDVFDQPVFINRLPQKSPAGVVQELTHIAQLFTLSDDEHTELVRLGFDPHTTVLSDFFTKAHIRFGPEFIGSLPQCDDFMYHISLISASHHFAQGEIPPDYNELLHTAQSGNIEQTDTPSYTLIAFLEILDKVDARVNRTKDNVDDAINTMRRIVAALTRKNHSQTIATMYDTVFNGLNNDILRTIDKRPKSN